MYLLLTGFTVCLNLTSAWSPSVMFSSPTALRQQRGSAGGMLMSIAERDANEIMNEIPSKKTMLTKNIKQSDPIPEAGILEAVKIMQQGKLYRYNVPTAEESIVSICEKEVGEYTGHKYVVALNSCGSALFLALKAAGVQPGDKVLTNAFTFTAVPSAIEHKRRRGRVR